MWCIFFIWCDRKGVFYLCLLYRVKNYYSTVLWFAFCKSSISFRFASIKWNKTWEHLWLERILFQITRFVIQWYETFHKWFTRLVMQGYDMFYKTNVEVWKYVEILCGCMWKYWIFQNFTPLIHSALKIVGSLGYLHSKYPAQCLDWPKTHFV